MPRRPPRSRRRRVIRQISSHLRGESLERRQVLASVLDAQQVAALAQGIGMFADRMDQVAEHDLLGRKAAALGQPLATLVPLGDRLHADFVDRIVGLSGSKTPAQIDAILSAATGTAVTHASQVVAGAEHLWFSVPLSRTTMLPSYRLDLGQRPAEPEQDAGAVPPSLSDQGLRLGDVDVSLTTGVEGTVSLGIDVSAGLSAEQAFMIKFDDLRAFGRASHTGKAAIADIDAEYGILRLGPADLDVSIDTGVTLNLQEGGATFVRLGELAGMSLADFESRLSLTATGPGVSVTVPFTLGLDGFTQKTGSAQQVKITATDLLDPRSLTIDYPDLTVSGVAEPFDFTQFADISAADLGTFVGDLGRWVPELGHGFEIPVVARDVADLFSGSWRTWLDDRLAGAQDDFDTIEGMFDTLSESLGSSRAGFSSSWNSKLGAIEWTLPLAITDPATTTTRVSFDAAALVPNNLGLRLSSKGSATVTATATLGIRGGITIASTAQSVTAATLLSKLNDGAGLVWSSTNAGARQAASGQATIGIATPAVITSPGHGLATGEPVMFSTTGSLPTPLLPNTPYSVIRVDADHFQIAPWSGGGPIGTVGPQSGTHTFSRPDLVFSLRDGSALAYDLSTLALGRNGAAGTATVGDLLALVNNSPRAGGRLSLSLAASALVANDLTAPATAAAEFAVISPTYVFTIGSGDAAIVTTQTSLAAAALGLVAAPTTGPTLTGSALASRSRRDQAYVADDSTASIVIKIDASLTAGASLGPLALTVHSGAIEGSATLAVRLVDPASGVADHRITLAEMAGGMAAVVATSVSSRDLNGILQLRVAPAAAEQSLKIDFANYITYGEGKTDDGVAKQALLVAKGPGTVAVNAPNGALVPYLTLASSKNPAAWEFSVTPSPKLASIATGLGSVSADDLRGLLDGFGSFLEHSPLWTFDLPVLGVSLGDAFGIADVLASVPSFDMAAVFGRPTFDANGAASWPDFSLGRLGTAFLDAFNAPAALPTLAGLDAFARLERLTWSLDDLIVEWEGWTPGNAAADLAILQRIRGWFAEAAIAFPDLWKAWKLGTANIEPTTIAFAKLLWLPQFSQGVGLPTFNAAWLNGLNAAGTPGRLTADEISAAFPRLDFGGLSGFMADLDTLSLPGGRPLAVSATVDNAGRLVFTLIVDADVSVSRPIPAFELPGGLPLAVTSSGVLTLDFGGRLTGVFGIDLATGSTFFDTTASAIDVTAQVDDGGGLVMAASIGGLAGVSLGSNGAGLEKARIRLGELAADGSLIGPAHFTLSGGTIQPSKAAIDLRLPIYLQPSNTYGGTLGFGGGVTIAATPDGASQSVSFTAQPITDKRFQNGYDGTGTIDADGNPFTSILDLVEAASFSIDTWIEGAGAFVSLLRTTLASDLLADVPFVGGVDVSDTGLLGRLDGFFTKGGSYDSPRALDAWLARKLAGLGYARQPAKPTTGPFPENAFSFSFRTRSAGGGVAALSANDATPFGQLLSGGSELVVDLWLSSTSTQQLAGGAIDFGLPALGMAIEGAAAINLATTFTLDVGLAASLTKGFSVETDADTEFRASVGLDLPADLKLRLGGLVFDYTEASAGPELAASLTADLGAGSVGLAGLAGALDTLSIAGTVEAEVRADLAAHIFGDGPGIGMVFAMGYEESPIDTLSADNFYFTIEDTYVSLGKLLSGPIATMLGWVEDVLEPVRPILDILRSEVPMVSDVSKFAGRGPITVLDAIRHTSQGRYDETVKFLEYVLIIDKVASSLDQIGGDLKVSLGGVNFQGSTGSVADLFGVSADVEGLLRGSTQDALASLEKGIGLASEVLADPEKLLSDDDGGPPPPGTATAYATITQGHFTFPMFDDPAGVLIKMLLGGNPDLVKWDMPDLMATAQFNLPINIFGPLFAEIFGGITFTTDFTLGFDTYGLRQVLNGGSASRLTNGIYFGDDPSPGDGADPFEVRVDATIGAGAYLDAIVASAGVRGGVTGFLGANLKDNDGDGKVHLDELVGNFRSGPECIFDLSGSLDAFFESWIKVGVSTPFGFVTLWSDSYDIASANLVDWNHVACPPVEADLASKDSSFVLADGSAVRALVLNTGPLAGRVYPGDTEDGDEEFLVDYDAATDTIIVKAYDAEEDRNHNGRIDDSEKGNGISYAAADVQWIVFDMGLGNDTILFTDAVPERIGVQGYGGPGNDQLIGGRGRNVLFGDGGVVPGDAGRDRLVGNAAADELHGGGDNDVLLGAGGADAISGDAGNDQIEGGDEARGPGGAPVGDAIAGGDGDDVIIAGAGDDDVDAGFGNDTVDGGAGDDKLQGGAGNDKLYGREGDDRIYGDDAIGLITATGASIGDGSAVNVNADLIEGGTGFNYLSGGPGYDILYADSESAGPGAAAVHAPVDVVVRSTTAGRGFTTPLIATGWAEDEAGRGSRLFKAVILGGEGNDTIYGTAGRDYIDGGFDSDLIEFGSGDDYVLGGPGSDAIVVTTDATLAITGGDATIFGGDGRDVVDGGAGANWIEGGPGDDSIFARQGADTVHGGTTAIGYQHYLDDRTHGRAVEESIHGGFRATVAADSCGPEIFFYPEVYPAEERSPITGFIFEDLDADGVRDAGEPDAPGNLQWGLVVTDATGGIVSMGNAGGGKFTSPADGDYASGRYVVWVGRYLLAGGVIESIPAGWVPSTPLIAGVSLGGASPAPPPQFGYYRPGRLAGSVTTTANQPVADVVVYLDADADGTYDAGTEQVTTTGADGAYAFADLRPGDYRIAIADIAACGRVTSPATATHAVTLASGGSATAYDFRVTLNTAPVVDGVFVGTDTQAITWTSIAGGAAQLTAIPAAEHHYLAFEICTTASPLTIKQGAQLVRTDATPSPESIALVLMPADAARPNWVRYEIAKVSGGRTLVPGRYRVLLDDDSVTSATGALLDGEWTTGVSRFPSGNGTAGTAAKNRFEFEFVIGAAAAGASLIDGIVARGMAPQPATIQGTIWQHDPREANIGQSAHEVGIGGQLVIVTDGAGVVQSVVTTAPLDVDGDGRIQATEQGGFRLSNLSPGSYTIQQMPTVPWRQATPGGVWQEEQLLSIGFDASDSNAANWKSILHTIDPDTQVATKVREFGEFEARDLAAPAAGVIFITGTARSGPAIGTHRLWRYDTVTQALVDLGQTPGIAPLVGFDALDDATLIGTNNDGIFLYDIATARWTAKGAILTQDDVRYYPVGDVAVAGARKVWAIAVPQKPDNPGAAVDQALVLLDPTVEVGNATLVRLLRTNNGATTISDTEPVIGLETNPLGGLFGLTRSERLYAIETAVGGGSTWLGNKQVTNLPDLSAGGLAWMPGGLVPDFGRDEFVITVSAGQTVTIGFGDVPDAVLLHDGDDFIDGGCGDDVDALHGDDGDDLPANVITEGGKDWIRGRGGNDWIAGGQRGDRLFGDEGDDRIFGGATEPNWIDGGDGNDSQLYGGAAADVILGGAGNDADIRGGGGDDRVFGGAGNDVLRGGTGDDTLVGGAGFDMVFGEAGDDTLVVIDALSGGEYAANPAGTKPDAYDGGGDTDTIVVSANADTDLSDVDVMLYGVTHAIARIEIGLLTGGKDGNTIDAAAFSGATAIRGLGGKDTLRGGSAGDRIFGGDGDDTITGNGDNDFLYGDAGIDTIHGNAGIDRIEGGAAGDSLFGDAGTDIIYGGDGEDAINGGDDGDVLFGEGDGDTIDGGAGADRIDGGAGYNLLRGGADNDTYVFAGVVDAVVVEAAGGGTDTLDLTACTGNLTMTIGDASTGTSIYGYSPSVSLRYYDDQIERVTLGSGDDFVDLAAGVTTVARIDAGGGSDTLSYAGYGWSTSPWAAGVTVDLAAGTATGFTTGVASFENASGGAGNDTLAGTDGPNTIDGGAGNDSLVGRDGDDTLRGNTGNDSLDGGSGDDSLWGWSGTNTLTGGVGNDLYGVFEAGQTDTVVEAVGQGTDTIDCSWVSGTAITVNIAATIVATFGPSRVTAATPGAIDRIVGGSQADRFVLAQGSAFAGALDGGGIAGYADDDKNTLDYSGWAIPVTVNYTGSLDASFVGTATGTSGVRSLSHVIGGSAGDTLIAGEGTPAWFEGRGGNDTLTSRVQYDRLEGGDDDDTLSAGGGSDWLDGGAGADHLDGGADGDWLYGRAGDDELRGGGGDDTLSGGWGSDRLVGGTGNDYYVFEDLFGHDTVVEDPSAGTDSLNFGAVTLPLEVRLGSVNVTGPGESVTYAGNSIEEVVGGTADDTFVMTAPTVVFNGWLDGGGGTNTLRYDDATPAITVAVAAGQKPNVFGAFSFASVVAVPPASMIAISVPAGTTTTDAITRTGISQIVKQGAGTLVLDRTNSHSGGTLVEAGEVIVKSVSALGIGGLEVAAGAKATFDVGHSAIKLGSIKFDGLVNLGEATMTVASGLTSASLVAALVAGRGDGSWNGSHGIASSAAAAQTAAGVPRTVGWTDNGDGSFTIGYTAPGDANLDKRVDILDAANFIASGKFDTGQAATWAEGNFNYDLVVDILDVADFFNGRIFDSGPLAAANASTPTTDTTTTSMNNLVFAALAQNEQSRTTARKKAFAVL